MKNYKTVVKYVIYFVGLVLLSGARTKSGLSPFALGLFIALVYARQNLFILAPMYVLATVLGDFSWYGLIYGASPVIVLSAANLIHLKLKKPISMAAVNAYALVSQIPYIAVGLLSGELVNTITQVVVAQVFVYADIIVVYALLIRGLKYRFTLDELASAAMLAGALALALYQINVYGYRPYFTVCAFIVMLSVFLFSGGVPVVIAAVLGLGAAFGDGGIMMVAALVLWAVPAALFRKGSIWLGGAALVLAEVVLGYFFGAYGGYSYIQLIAVAVGTLAFLLLPKKLKSSLCGTLGTTADGYANRTIVNRNRLDVSNRLYSVAEIFLDMHKVLRGDVTEIESECGKEKIAKDVAMSYCAHCPDSAVCFKALGTDTSVIIADLVEVCESKGRVTIIDMPPFITGRCKRMNGLITAVNERTEAHKSYAKVAASLNNGKLMLAEQMSGTAAILGNLAEDVKKAVSFDTSREKLIIDELAYHNIICSEATVYGEGDVCVTVVVREQDADKRILPRIVSKVVKCPLIAEGAPDISGARASLHLVTAPKYDVVYGEAARSGGEEAPCGDSRSAQRIGEGKVVFALCDGMGRGGEAERSSSTAIAMIENFYRAGFDNAVILSLVNKLLALKNEENFTTLDMTVIDLKSGAADLIKMGAADGFIIRKDKIEVVSGSALPMGIVEEVEPSVERKLLFTGDMILLVSDGVTDVLGRDGVIDVIATERSANPQTMADAVLQAAITAGATDDITSFCCKLYSVAGG